MQKRNYSQIIAIDPDCEKSGVACFDLEDMEVWCDAMSFAKVMDYYQELRKQNNFLLVIEAGYLNKKANWHSNLNVGTAGRIGENTGRNHQTARLLVEMAKHYGLNAVEALPLKKCWKGKDGKISAEELNKILSSSGVNILPRTNQDKRDAVLLSLIYSGKPLKCK